VAEVPDEDLVRELERLRRAYRGKLIEMIARLGSLVREAREVCDGDELQAARNLAHRLKGTSGSYGFDECSEEFRKIEERLEHLGDGAPANAAAAWLEIEQALARARSGCS
jgi:HPt (histidine-containing phosphotransfer) domain-containing protein